MSSNSVSTPKVSLSTAGSKIVTWLSGPVVLSIVIAFVIGGGFMAITGVNPIQGYISMFTGSFGSGIGIANTIVRAVPLVGMALAISVAFRAGIINLGGEGQMILGGLAAGLVALFMPGPSVLVVFVSLLTGAAVGAAWATLSSLMYLWPGVPILLTSLLLNYPARFFTSWVIRFPLKDPQSSMVASPAIADDRMIPLLASKGSPLGGLLMDSLGKDAALTIIGRTVNWSLLIMILVVIAISFMNKRTIFGFESGINGKNHRFASYAGVRTTKMTVQTMALSGGLAGLVGALLTIGAPNTRIIEGNLFATNYAWIGLLVALLALYRPAGVVLAGIFFAAIIAGSGALGRDLGMSPQIAAVIQGIAIVLIAFRVEWPKKWFGKQNDPVSLAQPDREAQLMNKSSVTAELAEVSADNTPKEG